MAPDASHSPSKDAGQNANPTLTSSTSSNTKRPSREDYAKKGWGSRMNFQLSYGLKPGTPLPLSACLSIHSSYETT